MIVKTVYDETEINKILFDDWMYDRITDDSCPPKEAARKLDLYKYWHCLGCYIDNEIRGLLTVHQSEHGPMVHMHMGKNYRDDAFEFASIFLERVLPKFKELYAEIPSLYPDVIGFVKKMGFKEVSILKEKHTKNGNHYDVYLFHKEI